MLKIHYAASQLLTILLLKMHNRVLTKGQHCALWFNKENALLNVTHFSVLHKGSRISVLLLHQKLGICFYLEDNPVSRYAVTTRQIFTCYYRFRLLYQGDSIQTWWGWPSAREWNFEMVANAPQKYRMNPHLVPIPHSLSRHNSSLCRLHHPSQDTPARTVCSALGHFYPSLPSIRHPALCRM